MTVDLYGKVVTEIRDYPSVTAIVGQKVRRQFGKDEGPPFVRLIKLSNDFAPLGRGYRAGLQRPLFVALCYGVNDVQAGQLAGAVIDAVNLRGPRRDAQGRYIALSLVEGGGTQSTDPLTNWPHEDITFSVIGAASAVA